VLAAPDLVDGSGRTVVAVAFLFAYTLVRSVKPIYEAKGFARMASLVGEAALIGIAVAATGYFESPIAFSLLTAVSVAGFIAGFGTALRLAAATTLAIGIPSITEGVSFQDDIRLVAQWAVELFLVAIVAAYARRISGEADERQAVALDRMGRLSDANELLFSLHQVAQELPASLDLSEALDSTIERLRDLLSFDTAAILVFEESDGSWSVARRYGARLPNALPASELPPPVKRAARGLLPVVEVPNALRANGPGLSHQAVSGLYAPLQARGFLIGVMAVERHQLDPFTERDVELLAGFAEPAALAIDNARWFARLRTVGADEERTRIARDLHDRIGQSLAYLAFELDRILRKDERGDRVTPDLVGIREDVRGVVREVRDTLYDLRTDVSDERNIPAVLEEFAQRVRDRSGIEVLLRLDETDRIPRPQERELWRIAQEAIVNAERHSHGTRIDVFWLSDGREAVLEVRDNGSGLPIGAAGRLDSYGMLGMRERAASIGANLAIGSIPREGVTVRVSLRSAPDSADAL
jgi:signal transduction histidine kinase